MSSTSTSPTTTTATTSHGGTTGGTNGTTPHPKPSAGPGSFAEIAPLMTLADMMAPMAVRVAATLRLADRIAEGHTVLADLAVEAGVDSDALRRLLRYLRVRGVFAEPRPGVYALTDLARLLLDEHPARLRTRFDLNSPVGRGDLSFIHLLHSIRSGGPAFAQMYGRSFWEDVDADPQRVSDFAAMMSANVSESGIETEYDWSDAGHVVDVGGGDGTLITQVLRAHPHVRGTVVDLPVTAQRARESLADAGIAERCAVRPGSFFDPLPAGADVYLLCKILHDWGDAEAVTILRRCAEAARPHGRVLIIEADPARSENELGFTYLDLHMLVYFGGKERTAEQYRELAAAAGMDLRRVGDGKWGAAIYECTPAAHAGS